MKWDRSKGRPEPIRALNRIKEIEGGEPLVPLAEFAPSVVIFRSTVIPYVRKGVAEMAERAAKILAPEYKLGITDAWRPFERQVRIYQWMQGQLDAARPDLSPAAKRRILCRWVAPVDQKAPPGHCTGAAIDVNLLDQQGQIVDVTSPYERLQGGPTYVYGLTEEAQRHRMLLVETLLAVGFSNCRDEWWHYSYGDAGWAVRMGHDTCFYGKISLDPALYATQEEEWIRGVADRQNPFIVPAS